jgi:hypothetical protein
MSSWSGLPAGFTRIGWKPVIEIVGKPMPDKP